MTRRIIAIAANTFREAVRDRVFFGLLAFAALYIPLTIFLGKLSLGDLTMIRSFGLAGVYLSTMLMTVLLGASLLSTDIARRTLYFVLAKPVSRAEVVLGKFCGLFAAIAATTTFMAGGGLAGGACPGGGVDGAGLLAIGMGLVEVGLFIALLLALSAVLAPLTATICAAIVLVTGHLVDSALATAARFGGALQTFLLTLHYLFPNLEKFDLRDLVVHNIVPDGTALLFAVGYGAVYAGFLLVLAILLFERREL